MEDITKLDLYGIIGAEITSTEAEIKKAYRKKALSCHPDKNPDNPKAAELFLQLSKVLEILTDPKAKAAYDRVIQAREEAKVRAKERSSKRQKLVDDLEAREEAFRRAKDPNYYASGKTDEEQLKAEIERLRKEGSRLVEEEKERLRQKILEELSRESSSKVYSEEECTVKIKWKAEKDDEENGGYNAENLNRFLSKYGEVAALVISGSKKGSALVQFKTRDAAESAVTIERGLATNPMRLTGLWQKKKTAQPVPKIINPVFGNLFPAAARPAQGQMNFSQGLSFSSAPDIFNFQPQADIVSNNQSEADFEDEVLKNLRRAEERRKLIEQMEAEEKGS